GEDGLVVQRPRPVPHLDRVEPGLAELPAAGHARGERVGGDREAAGTVDLLGEAGQPAVDRPVTPVDPGPGWQAERRVVAVAGGDLLAVDDEQVGPGELAPDGGRA